MPEWAKRAVAWATAHWRSLGTIAAIGIVGRFVKWLVDIRKGWAEGSKAKIDLAETKRENTIAEFYRQIDSELFTAVGIIQPTSSPKAEHEKDQELMDEAWRRWQRDHPIAPRD